METQQQQQPGKVHAAICAVMAEIGAVGKDGKNKEQNYSFRSVDAVTDAMHPLLVKHHLYVRPSKILSDEIGKGPNDKGFRVRQRLVYRITHAEDGSFVDGEVTGEGVDYGDKASNKAMAVSFKYFLCQTFCIPIHDPDSDPDTQSPENGPPKQQQQRQPAQQQAKPSEKKPSPAAVLANILKSKGEDTPAKALAWMGRQLKREVKSMKDLKPAEVEQLTKLANEIPAPGAGPQE